MTIKPRGENADALTEGDHSGPGGISWTMVGDKKRPGLGPDEELRDGGEDGDDDQGEQEVLALVKAGQH